MCINFLSHICLFKGSANTHTSILHCAWIPGYAVGKKKTTNQQLGSFLFLATWHANNNKSNNSSGNNVGYNIHLNTFKRAKIVSRIEIMPTAHVCVCASVCVCVSVYVSVCMCLRVVAASCSMLNSTLSRTPCQL